MSKEMFTLFFHYLLWFFSLKYKVVRLSFFSEEKKYEWLWQPFWIVYWLCIYRRNEDDTEKNIFVSHKYSRMGIFQIFFYAKFRYCFHKLKDRMNKTKTLLLLLLFHRKLIRNAIKSSRLSDLFEINAYTFIDWFFFVLLLFLFVTKVANICYVSVLYYIT